MFKPLRFNPHLKAEPNKDHQEKVENKLVHGRTHEELRLEEKETKTIEHGKAHITREVKETDVVTKETPRGKVKKVTEVDVVTKSHEDRDGDGSVIDEVHSTVVSVASVEMTPPHPPREETAAYTKSHQHLVFKLDSPCAMCGVRHSTLNDPKENPFGAKSLETHHYPIERSLAHACDPKKVGMVFPEVKDHETLEAFIDSEQNLMVLCDIHHRHPLHGIHHLTPQDFFVQPFLWKGYQIVAAETESDKISDLNEKIIERQEKRLGIEFENA
ncbi:MAG TPA: hypothetical protein VFN35_08035 [Ktedonobacteraceae bacterium]|nr:hypothetical protein [Ktedonobacteraceae bacterium]